MRSTLHVLTEMVFCRVCNSIIEFFFSTLKSSGNKSLALPNTRPSECKSYIFYMHTNPFLKQ